MDEWCVVIVVGFFEGCSFNLVDNINFVISSNKVFGVYVELVNWYVGRGELVEMGFGWILVKG